MLKEWEQLGYDTRGFDLDTPRGFAEVGEYSQSRGAWPDLEDLSKEWDQRTFKVLLPDLNGELIALVAIFKCHANLVLLSVEAICGGLERGKTACAWCLLWR
jgi:hypothetical protein